MRQLKTDADLSGFFLILRFPAYNDETCGVCFFPADVFRKDLKAEYLACLTACDGCHTFISHFADLFGCACGVFHFFLFPGRVLFQKGFALSKSLWMGADFPDIFHRCIRHSKKHMIHTDDLLTYDIKFVFHEKVVDISHDTCGGILDGKYRIVCFSVGYILHGCTPGFYVIAFDIFSKVLAHGSIAVGSLYSLEYNGCVFKGNMLYSCKVTFSVNSMFCKQLVLSLAADSHDLAKKLLHAKAVKVSVGFFFQGMDFLALTCRIQYLFACFYFVFSDFFTHLHSFFKETYDLAVDLIDLVSVSFQISH